MGEAEALINSCSLTANQLADQDLPSPLAPNNIKRLFLLHQLWRKVQQLANVFWTCLKKEFLLERNLHI